MIKQRAKNTEPHSQTFTSISHISGDVTYMHKAYSLKSAKNTGHSWTGAITAFTTKRSNKGRRCKFNLTGNISGDVHKAYSLKSAKNTGHSWTGAITAFTTKRSNKGRRCKFNLTGKWRVKRRRAFFAGAFLEKFKGHLRSRFSS